ncbi:MAG: alanine racemase [Planctomycetaceae bacterium]|nr:alanine racemase [Planctomycetaceae bacterium]
MFAQSTIRIELDALASNLASVAAHVGGGLERLCAVVKADAYGLGAVRMAAAMHRIGISRFAAYGPSEAAEVADASPDSVVIVLMPVRELARDARSISLLGRQRLHFTAHHPAQVRSLEAEATRLGVVIPLQLELDTGMGRGGCEEGEAEEILQIIAASPRLRLAGLMSHLPDAVDDPFSAIERGRRFDRFVDSMGALIPEGVVRHVAATASLESSPLHFDQVRIGLAWIGFGSSVLAGRPDPMPLRSIFSWWSTVIQTRRLEPGRTIGYGCTMLTDRETLTGLIPIGYADGLPAVSGSESHRLVIHGRRGAVSVPVLGRMNMDQCVVDLTDVGPLDDTTAVEVISADPDSPVRLDRVAARAGVLPYQLLCGISHRIPRLLVAGGGAVADRGDSIITEAESESRRSIGG